MIYGTRGVVEWLIKHEAKPSALSDTRPQPECHKSRSLVEHDLPTLNGLKYMPRLTRSSCNAITESGILLAAWRGPSILLGILGELPSVLDVQ